MDLVIIGAGGFGREVLDVFNASRAAGDSSADTFVGFIDDGTPDLERLARLGAVHLGGADALSNYDGAQFVVGVGNPHVRRALVSQAIHAGLVPASPLIHPAATIGADVEIGDGSVLCAGVRLTTNIRLGAHVHLNLNVTIGHDTVLNDYVTVNPLAAVSGDVILHEDVTIGTTACVNQGLEVGPGATVGAGAAVVKVVEPGTTVVGVPAKPLGGR